MELLERRRMKGPESTYRTDAKVWELGDYQPSHKSFPGVHLGLLLTKLVDVSSIDEERLKLIDHTRGNEDEVKNSEELQLQIRNAIADLPEREAVEQSRSDV